MKNPYFIVLLLFGSVLLADEPVLRWAADAESGAPNVFYENGDLSKLVGFEKDIIDHIAKRLGRKAEFHQNDWDGLISGLQRDLYDVVINGFSPEEGKENSAIFSNPYYACGLSLIVRSNTDTIKSILDCSGAIVGVLRSSKAENILINSLKDVKVIGYPNEYCAISDLKDKRVDAILLDGQNAAYYTRKLSGLKIVDELDEIKYSIVSTPKNSELMAAINDIIGDMQRDGSLDAIVSKWGLHNTSYSHLCEKSRGSKTETTSLNPGSPGGQDKPTVQYVKVLPFFIKAAYVTLMISILSMCVAIVLGLCFAIMRVYMPKWISFFAISVIELLRGIPLLIQLFFVFYGLPCIGITLPPLVAGILTLGMNYAAYEAENFRAGMAAVPYGQMEAARALGMNQWQSLRHVILPQAFTFVLPPLTNDFIAILKDSSLVSLITIMELTKTYMLIASNSFNFFGMGAIVALIYFLIGLPFAQLAKLAEKHLKLEKRAYSSRKIGGRYNR
ncbi:MAG: ABC transporter substrate-binding protein/permease [Puniceicoccales bacterium]|jgi:polar amino acid transport system substrate-binding protein|nr:ABC transporter substrate-binding protein/permease [Puniceicoccales bacterium]